MTWKELKELAEEAGVKDDTVVELFIDQTDTKTNIVENGISDDIWYLQ